MVRSHVEQYLAHCTLLLSSLNHLMGGLRKKQMMLSLGSLATFAFNRWMQECSEAIAHAISVLALLLVIFILGAVSYIVLRESQRRYSNALFDLGGEYVRRWGPLYGTLRADRLLFVILFPAATLLRSMITSFAQGRALAQVCTMIAVDVVVCVGEPWHPRSPEM